MSILWNITFTRDAKISKCGNLIVLVSFPVAGIKFSEKKKKTTQGKKRFILTLYSGYQSIMKRGAETIWRDEQSRGRE